MEVVYYYNKDCMCSYTNFNTILKVLKDLNLSPKIILVETSVLCEDEIAKDALDDAEIAKIKQFLIDSPQKQGNEYPSATLKIQNVVIEGLKDYSYYEFAFSCFYNEDRDEILSSGECFCSGKFCE